MTNEPDKQLELLKSKSSSTISHLAHEANVEHKNFQRPKEIFFVKWLLGISLSVVTI